VARRYRLVPPWFCLLFFFGGALPMSIQSGTCRMINSQVTLYVHTITRNQTRTQAISHMTRAQAISHNPTNSICSTQQTVAHRPTPILGLTRPGNYSFYHARERRHAAGESRQHASTCFNMLQRMTPKVMHGPCQAAFR
jgi:hypothetical protein